MSELIVLGQIEDHDGSHEGSVAFMDDGQLTLEAFDHDALDHVVLRIPDNAIVEIRDWLNAYLQENEQ